MTPNHASILRSSPLRKALSAAPVRHDTLTPSVRQSFASTLAKAQAKPSVAPPYSVAQGSLPFREEITAAANKYGVDPALLAAVVKQESNFNPRAQSQVGAKGLTQLMDATSRGLGVTDSFDPAQSLDGGAKFLGSLLKQFHGDERLALAAYNAGPAAVQKFGGIPPYQETQRYVPKVLGYAAQFRRIIGG